MPGKANNNSSSTRNLVSLAELPEEERRAMASRAGRASGKARRRKRDALEWAKWIGESAFDLKMPGGKVVKGNLDGGVILRQYQKAIQGDTRAATMLLKLKGMFVDKVDVTSGGGRGFTVEVVDRNLADTLARALTDGDGKDNDRKEE